MPRQTPRVPSCRLRKPSGQAVVRLGGVGGHRAYAKFNLLRTRISPMVDRIVASPQVLTYHLTADGAFPNHPSLPLLVYKAVAADTDQELADLWAQVFRDNGWGGIWANGVFSFHHFHSNAHEVLGVAGGSATLQFGGPAGPAVDVQAGDVAILPAGCAHKNVRADGGFRVIGAYPWGQERYDLRRGDSAELAEVQANIAHVPKPTTDPVYGDDGPLFDHW